MEEKERFDVVRRARSFSHAGRGLALFIRTTHNAWIHFAILAIAVAGGLFVDLSRMEWLLLAMAAGLVLATEAINTAIEIDIDLTSPEHHPFARDTKDVAAGAVLISACTAVLIGCGIFAPHLAQLFG